MKYVRLPKVVLTKECSRGEVDGEVDSGSFDRRRLGGEPAMISSNRGRCSGVDLSESGMSILARWRMASFFWKSALTRRKNGMLSWGRSSLVADDTSASAAIDQK